MAVMVRVELVERLLNPRIVGVIADPRSHLLTVDVMAMINWMVAEVLVGHRDADGSADRNAYKGDAG